MKPNTDKLEVKLRDGASNPFYKRTIDYNNLRDKEELIDELWDVAGIELPLRKDKRKRKSQMVEIIGGNDWFRK